MFSGGLDETLVDAAGSKDDAELGIYQLFKERAVYSKKNGFKGNFLFPQVLNFRGDYPSDYPDNFFGDFLSGFPGGFRGALPNSLPNPFGITQLADHDSERKSSFNFLFQFGGEPFQCPRRRLPCRFISISI